MNQLKYLKIKFLKANNIKIIRGDFKDTFKRNLKF